MPYLIKQRLWQKEFYTMDRQALRQKDFYTMDKQALRQKYKEIRKNVEKDGIAQNFMRSHIFQNANTVMTYINIGSEPDTSAILQSKKTVLVPVTFKEQGIIKPCVYRGKTVKGAYGISEPEQFTEFPADKINIVIVPGLCFCTNGARLGYGGGYYDKFLCGYNGTIVGFCYEECLTDLDFSQPHDIRVHYIFTQERTIKI